MKWVIHILQVTFALTFIFSGAAKCIDPMGTSLKFNEYLLYFGFDFLTTLTMGMAWLMSIAEFGIGFSLLLGCGRNVCLFLATTMMLIFTPLTLWLACTDAIQDCGCFGDALRLTNWETFAKNVLLDAILVVLIYKRKLMYRLLGQTNFTFYFYWAMFVMVGLCWIGTFREPYIDFRPYHPGINITAGVLGQQSEGASNEEVTYTCIYERNGERKEFALDDIPDEEDGWEFIETIEHSAGSEAGDDDSITPGEKPLSLDFYARSEDGELFTEELLRRDGYTMLLLSATLDQASQYNIKEIEDLYEYSLDQGYAFYCLTSRDTLQVNQWKFNTGAEYPFLFTDAQIVETIVRSNPGLLLIRDGILCWKENLSSVDVDALISAKLNEQSYGQIREIDYRKRFLALLILLFGPLPLSLCFEIPKFIKINKQKN